MLKIQHFKNVKIPSLRIYLFSGPSGEAKARVMAYFGEGSGPIHVDNVKCSGEERSLADCSMRAPGRHNCRHSEDAGVICDYDQSQLSSKEVKGEIMSAEIQRMV